MHLTTLGGRRIPLEEYPFRQVLESQKAIHDLRFYIQIGDLPTRLLSIYGTPIFDSRDEFDGVVVAFNDITEQEKSRARLEESERRFREMLANVELVALILNASGNITFCNDFFWN